MSGGSARARAGRRLRSVLGRASTVAVGCLGRGELLTVACREGIGWAVHLPNFSAFAQGKHSPSISSCQCERVETWPTSAPSSVDNCRERASGCLCFAALCLEIYPQLPPQLPSHLPALAPDLSPLPRRREEPPCFFSSAIGCARAVTSRWPAQAHSWPQHCFCKVCSETPPESAPLPAPLWGFATCHRGEVPSPLSLLSRGLWRGAPSPPGSPHRLTPGGFSTATECAWRHLNCQLIIPQLRLTIATSPPGGRASCLPFGREFSLTALPSHGSHCAGRAGFLGAEPWWCGSSCYACSQRG